MIVDLLCGPQPAVAPLRCATSTPPYVTAGRSQRGVGWHYIAPAYLPRQPQDVFVESYVREALIRLNPEHRRAPRPRRRGDLQAARHRALRAHRRPDQGQRGIHRLAARRPLDALWPPPRARHRAPDRLRRPGRQPVRRHQRSTPSAPGRPSAAPTWCCSSTASRWCWSRPRRRCATQSAGSTAPCRSTTTTSASCPSSSPANVFSVATEGKDAALRLDPHAGGAVGAVAATPTRHADRRTGWSNLASARVELPAAPQRRARHPGQLHALRHRQARSAASRSSAATSSTRPPTRSCSACWPAAPKKGLIWHFQGSGKSLLMVFAAQKLRLQPALRNPDRAHRRGPHRPRHPDQRHLPRLRHPQPGQGRIARGAGAAAAPGHAQDHHHHHLQVRRGRAACSTTATTSSCWWTRRTARRRATWA